MCEVTIELTQGKCAIIDAEDVHKVSGLSWHWDRSKMPSGYAVAQVPVGRVGAKHGVRRKRKNVAMHNLIIPPPAGLEVDHINGNGLDNRKINLRHATRAQQCANRGPQRGKSSQYKGVRFWKHGCKWQARIRIEGKEIHLGWFDTEASAANAYDEAAAEAFGEFVRLNLAGGY